MNRIILTACLAMSAMVTISAEKNTKPVKSAKPVALSREKDLANRMKWYGGDLIDRRAEKGSFYVINTQDAANAAILKSALNLATKDVRVTPKLIN